MRKGRWDIQPLKHDQQLYAAIDVYVRVLKYFFQKDVRRIFFFQISQVIYMDLAKREEEKIKKLKEFEEKHGKDWTFDPN